jgi:hypothetical protein
MPTAPVAPPAQTPCALHTHPPVHPPHPVLRPARRQASRCRRRSSRPRSWWCACTAGAGARAAGTQAGRSWHACVLQGAAAARARRRRRPQQWQWRLGRPPAQRPPPPWPPPTPLAPPPRDPGSFMMEYDIHTILDLMTAAATAGVLYAMIATPVRAPRRAPAPQRAPGHLVARGWGAPAAARAPDCSAPKLRRPRLPPPRRCPTPTRLTWTPSSPTLWCGGGAAVGRRAGGGDGSSGRRGRSRSGWQRAGGVLTAAPHQPGASRHPQIVPCIALAAIAHPYTSHWLPFRVGAAVQGALGRGRRGSLRRQCPGGRPPRAAQAARRVGAPLAPPRLPPAPASRPRAPRSCGRCACTWRPSACCRSCA